MKIKLLFFIGLSLLLSSCYTRYVYVYSDEPVNEVYIYDVNYVYTNLWYDDFYWRYDVGNYYNFGLYFYSPRYWAYSNYYGYYKHHRHKHHWYKPRKLKKRHNVVKNHHYRPKQRIMWEKTNTKLGHKSKQNVQLKPKNQRKFNTQAKKRDQVVTKWNWNNNSKKKTIIRQRNNKTQVSKMKPKFNKRNSSFKNKTKNLQRNNKPYNKIKKSTKKGQR